MSDSQTSYPKKVWALLIFSLLVSLFILATLFTPLTDVDTELSSTVPLALGSPELATTVESVVNSQRQPVDPELVVFHDGTVFLTDLLGEIGAARRSVTFTNYILEEGQMTGALLDALTAKAREGVQVRLLIDGNGGKHAPEDKLDALRSAGGKVETFRPLGFRTLTRINKRTHVRAIAIDGRIGYTGGLAFDDEWLGDGSQEKQWRDVMFKYRGAMARETQDVFNALWRQTSGEILAGPDFYPEDELGTVTGHDSVTATHASALSQEDSTRSAASDSATTTDTAAAASGSESWFVGLFHAPAPDIAGDLQDLVWLSFAGAADHVYITTPYLTPDADILDAIMRSARRGVRVELLVPGPYTDAKLIQAATRARYEDLLEAGVRLFEYQPGHFHAKTITADGHWSMIGSANLDNRSATLNVENVFVVEDRRLAGMLESEFAADKERSVEVTLETFHPGPFKRFYYNFARIFAKQY